MGLLHPSFAEAFSLYGVIPNKIYAKNEQGIERQILFNGEDCY